MLASIQSPIDQLGNSQVNPNAVPDGSLDHQPSVLSDNNDSTCCIAFEPQDSVPSGGQNESVTQPISDGLHSSQIAVVHAPPEGRESWGNISDGQGVKEYRKMNHTTLPFAASKRYTPPTTKKYTSPSSASAKYTPPEPGKNRASMLPNFGAFRTSESASAATEHRSSSSFARAGFGNSSSMSQTLGGREIFNSSRSENIDNTSTHSYRTAKSPIRSQNSFSSPTTTKYSDSGKRSSNVHGQGGIGGGSKKVSGLHQKPITGRKGDDNDFEENPRSRPVRPVHTVSLDEARRFLREVCANHPRPYPSTTLGPKISSENARHCLNFLIDHPPENEKERDLLLWLFSQQLFTALPSALAASNVQTTHIQAADNLIVMYWNSSAFSRDQIANAAFSDFETRARYILIMQRVHSMGDNLVHRKLSEKSAKDLVARISHLIEQTERDFHNNDEDINQSIKLLAIQGDPRRLLSDYCRNIKDIIEVIKTTPALSSRNTTTELDTGVDEDDAQFVQHHRTKRQNLDFRPSFRTTRVEPSLSELLVEPANPLAAHHSWCSNHQPRTPLR